MCRAGACAICGEAYQVAVIEGAGETLQRDGGNFRATLCHHRRHYRQHRHAARQFRPLLDRQQARPGRWAGDPASMSEISMGMVFPQKSSFLML